MSKPIAVNPWFVYELHSPWAGLGDSDDSDPAMLPFLGLNSNDEAQMRKIIRQFVVPYFRRVNQEGQKRIKEALAYCLSLPEGQFDFYRLMQSDLPPFPIPNNARLYYLWCWEECFPGEDFQIRDLSAWEYSPNCNEVNDVVRIKPFCSG